MQFILKCTTGVHYVWLAIYYIRSYCVFVNLGVYKIWLGKGKQISS